MQALLKDLAINTRLLNMYYSYLCIPIIKMTFTQRDKSVMGSLEQSDIFWLSFIKFISLVFLILKGVIFFKCINFVNVASSAYVRDNLCVCMLTFCNENLPWISNLSTVVESNFYLFTLCNSYLNIILPRPVKQALRSCIWKKIKTSSV